MVLCPKGTLHNNYNYDSKLACQALGALPYVDTILWGGDKVHGGQSPQGGQSQGEGDKVRGEGDKVRGRGTKWGQGHLAACAYTALPLGACPKGTSHNDSPSEQLSVTNKSVSNNVRTQNLTDESCAVLPWKHLPDGRCHLRTGRLPPCRAPVPPSLKHANSSPESVHAITKDTGT